ncbi:protein dispatched homolog 1-like isoform X1 [Montipora capricornis]|uniref:protein dispatched homolog 1-like isoform X1 n=1 Tax=Montipora capricornis TaxID=246305 RepID=UPI0035F219A0
MARKFVFACGNGVRFTRHDLIALCLAILIPITCIALTMVSVLPALGAKPLPSFNEPTKGFEPRGTKLSDKIITYQNYRYVYSALTSRPLKAQGAPQVQVQNKRKRRSLQNSLQPPFSPRFDHPDMVFVYEASDSTVNLFETNKLKTICAMDADIVRSNPYFNTSCISHYYNNNEPQCYSSWSLGNYIALLNTRKTCQEITDEDVSRVKALLQKCSVHFIQQTLTQHCEYPQLNKTDSPNCPSVPIDCIRHSAVYNIFQFLVDNKFLTTKQNTFLKYTLSIPPVSSDDELFEELYDKLKDSNHVKDGVQLAAFNFRYFKFDKFSKKLLAEVIFPALAMIVVFGIMWLFLGSFILTFCALFCIVYAIGLAYFFYNTVFGMKFFPFLNVLTLVFLVGIGADDAFVYYDIWRQTRTAYPKANIMQLTLKTLRYSALSMLVTSLTTASAFFAGTSSTITAIKCFGIFAGTSILTNYLLMITYFPAVVALHEKWVMKYNDVQSVDDIPSVEPAEVSGPGTQDISKCREGSTNDNANTQERPIFCILQVIDFPCSLAVAAKSAIHRFTWKIFGRGLPFLIIKFHWLWIALLICLTAGFLCVNFVKPGLNLPESKEFQLFSTSHVLEKYDLKYKSFFRFEKSGSINIELIWGIKPVDNGDHFDPDDKGTLEFDESFGNIFTEAGQKFLHSLCSSAKKLPLFDEFSGGQCPINTLIQKCTTGSNACCGENATFPFPRKVAEKCLLRLAQRSSTGLLFDPESGALKGFSIKINTEQQYTNAFSVMDSFYNKVETWVKTEMPQPPRGMQNVWVGSWWFDFYALQRSLSEGTFSSLGISVAVSFVVMLTTTLNVFISIYAIITIIGIICITIGSLVLAGWQLNILESIVMSVAVGLSIDFTMHYGVAYRLAPDKAHRESRVRYSLVHIGSAVTMAALTTFLTGLMMMPATVLVYYQLGQFLMLVMVFSWFHSTFGFLSICAVIGPKDNFGQLSIAHLLRRCGLCRVEPEAPQNPAEGDETVTLSSVGTAIEVGKKDTTTNL